MATMDRRKLHAKYYLIVDQISFASTEIGALVAGRVAATPWAKNDNVVFVGELRHILLFSLMAFDVAAVAINEQFRLVGDRKFHNMAADNDVAIIALDPTLGEGIVLDEDVLFLENLTDNYKAEWDARSGLIVEAALAGTKEFYVGSVLAVLAYAMQMAPSGTGLIYTETNFGFYDQSAAGLGLSAVDLLGPQGPIEIEKAHITLGSIVLGAS